jgi:TAP-like protein
MLLQRAIAAAGRGELVPLVRLVYANLYVDPLTLEPIADPSYSDAMYYGVDCQDYTYYSGAPGERVSEFVDEASAVAAQLPRLGSSIFLSDLACAFWPGAPEEMSRPAPLRAEGVTTLVLGSTGDPITPIGQGESVFERLADGYLVTQQGGPHVIFGRGIPCQDGLVTRFLVDGKRPAERRTTCPGELVTAYVPLAPVSALSFAGPRAAFVSAETEISYLPEYYYWDGLGTLSVGCPLGGGKIRFDETATGATMTLRSCAFSRGLRFTGSGSIDYGEDRVVLDVQAEGRFNGRFRYVSHGDSTVARS